MLPNKTRSLRELGGAPLESLSAIDARRLMAHNHSGDLRLSVSCIEARRKYYHIIIAKDLGMETGYTATQETEFLKSGNEVAK